MKKLKKPLCILLICRKKGNPILSNEPKQLRKLGFEQIICNAMDDYSKETMKFFTDELVPAIREL